MTNRNDIIALIIPNSAIDFYHDFLSILEETIEIIAESVFLAGFLVARNAFRTAHCVTAIDYMSSNKSVESSTRASTGITDVHRAGLP